MPNKKRLRATGPTVPPPKKRKATKELATLPLSCALVALVGTLLGPTEVERLHEAFSIETFIALARGVKELNLHDSQVSDDDLRRYATLFPALQTLTLFVCTKLTDAGLVSLSNLKSLRRLDLAWCIKITDTGLASLAPLKSLQTLNLIRCTEITDAGLASLATTLKSLQILNSL